MKKRLIALVLLSLPALAWSFAKPLRLLVPEWNGVTCTRSVCSDDPARLQHAVSLYRTTLGTFRVEGRPFDHRPRFIYCTTALCYRNFGGGNERAISYPYLGTLIAPTSWQDYITRHELVHWVQFKELGAVTTMRTPVWFREGMAYALSGAPDSDIPDHYRPMIERYERWSAEKSWADIVRLSSAL
jgi:hypothetical protein